MSVRNNSLELFTLIEDLIPPRLKEECLARFDTYCNKSVIYKTPSFKDVSLAPLSNREQISTPKDKTPSLRDISILQEGKSDTCSTEQTVNQDYKSSVICPFQPTLVEEIGNLPSFLS